VNTTVFQIQRVYLKDVSLEIPGAPQIFLEQDAPAMEIVLDVVLAQVAEAIHEVVISATLTTRVGQKVLFLIEAKQAGIFEIRGVPSEQLPVVLNVVCPNILYPYLRANVSDLVTRAGFPSVHLAEVNFEAFYQQRLAQSADAAARLN
jgi:preprotein translocase subunit SecB